MNLTLERLYATNKISKKGLVFRLNEYNGRMKLYNSSETALFRDDINWKDLGNYFHEKYNSSSKVNFYSFGSSTGKEAYSSVITLINTFGDKASKFFPIKSFDILKKIIQYAKEQQKKGCPNITNKYQIKDIFERIGFNTSEIQKYFDQSDWKLKLKPEIATSVELKQGNILDEWKNIDNKNPSIIMCRNMWPYVNNKEHEKIAKNLYNRLADNSCAIIGHFDNEQPSFLCFSYALKKAGFIPSKRAIGNNYFGEIIYEKK